MVRSGRAAISSGLTICSALTITVRAARAMSTSMCWYPSTCTLPSMSARWAWMRATSGLRAGTAASRSPVYGQVTVCRSSRAARSEPSMVRVGRNGTPIAPAL